MGVSGPEERISASNGSETGLPVLVLTTPDLRRKTVQKDTTRFQTLGDHFPSDHFVESPRRTKSHSIFVRDSESKD